MNTANYPTDFALFQLAIKHLQPDIDDYPNSTQASCSE
jgi:hypothetical protein